MKIRFQPKGGMCSVCAWKDHDCSELPFFEMLPVLSSYNEEDENGDMLSVMIVRCSEFQRLQ